MPLNWNTRVDLVDKINYCSLQHDVVVSGYSLL